MSLETTPGTSRTAVPGSNARPPRQKRSQETRESLLNAAERLLKNHSWEQISNMDIMREANCSNGAIYGRFKGKDDILMALYERHDQQLKSKFERRRKSKRQKLTLETYLDGEINYLIKTMVENRWLLRAVGLLSRSKPNVVTAEMRQQRKAMFQEVVSQVLQCEGTAIGPDQARQIEIAVFFVSTLLREALLYQGPHAGTLELSTKELKASVKQMALGFLGGVK